LNPRHGSARSPNLKGKRASRSGLGTSLLGPFLFATPLARLAPFKREAPVTGGDRGFGFLWGGTCDGEGNPSPPCSLYPLCVVLATPYDFEPTAILSPASCHA
jgi:hypothetical protein